MHQQLSPIVWHFVKFLICNDNELLSVCMILRFASKSNIPVFLVSLYWLSFKLQYKMSEHPDKGKNKMSIVNNINYKIW